MYGTAGIIDVTWKDEKEVWAVGGGGSMFVSKDGGKTFTFNKSADDIPGNLYKVRRFLFPCLVFQLSSPLRISLGAGLDSTCSGELTCPSYVCAPRHTGEVLRRQGLRAGVGGHPAALPRQRIGAQRDEHNLGKNSVGKYATYDSMSECRREEARRFGS